MINKTIKMVGFTLSLALVVALATGVAPPAAAGELDGMTLRVGSWGGSWQGIQKDLIAKKLEAMGAKIEFVKGNPSSNLAKLIASRGGEAPFDVFEIIDATLPSVMEGDFLQPLDYSLIPNAKYINKDRTRKKVVATWVTQEGICYLSDKFKELGIDPPTTYADLANPKLEGRVMIPDFVSGGGLAMLSGFAISQGGNIDNVKPGLDLVKKIKGVKFWKKGAQALTGMKSGDVYAAVIHGGWCIRAQKAGLKVATAYAKIDANTTGVVKQGWIGIVKGTKVSKAANMWINKFISAEFQVPFAKAKGAMPENRMAAPKLEGDPLLKRLMILDPDKMDKMLRVDFSKVDTVAWGDQWTRAVAK
jgi:putative spermidine/putrescine transport system substrate-binding protein